MSDGQGSRGPNTFWGGKEAKTGDWNDRSTKPGRKEFGWPDFETSSGRGKKQLGAAGAWDDDGAQTVIDSNPHLDLPEAELRVLSGPDVGQRVILDQVPFTVGRGLDNDFVIRDITMSRDHFTIDFSGVAYLIKDRSSGNGTIIDGQHCDDSRMLKDGDIIDLGKTHLLFWAPSQGSVDANRDVATVPPQDEALTMPVGDIASVHHSKPAAPAKVDPTQRLEKVSAPFRAFTNIRAKNTGFLVVLVLVAIALLGLALYVVFG